MSAQKPRDFFLSDARVIMTGGNEVRIAILKIPGAYTAGEGVRVREVSKDEIRVSRKDWELLGELVQGARFQIMAEAMERIERESLGE